MSDVQIGRGRFMLGDCLERMRELPDASVDMILCDLPYGTTQNKWDAVIPFDPLWAQYWRIAKPGAAVVLTAQCPFDKALGASQLQHLKYEWIWEKTEATGHLNAKKQPMKCHENILVFYRSQCLYSPLMTPGKKFRPAGGSSGAGSGNNYGSYGTRRESSGELRYPLSVLRMAKDEKNSKIHPTQKPVALFEYLIRTYTDEGMTVLDNCAGSGTTAVACERTGRNWVCIERDEGYYWRAVARVMDEVAS